MVLENACPQKMDGKFLQDAEQEEDGNLPLAQNKKIFSLRNRYTISKNEIIKSHKSFEEIFNKGDYFRANEISCCLLSVHPTREIKNRLKFGFATKKVKNKVSRNRNIRVLRELVRLNKNLFYQLCHNYGVHLNIIFVINCDLRVMNIQKEFLQNDLHDLVKYIELKFMEI